MAKYYTALMFSVVVVIFIPLQAAFILMDGTRTPASVAMAYVKAVYRLDPNLSDWMSAGLKQDTDEDPSDAYRYIMEQESLKWGHSADYIRSQVVAAHARTLEKGEETATVHVSGKRKRLINPLYTVFGQLFFLGNTYAFDHTIQLVKESGSWKVMTDPLTVAGI